jgi:hypothetical protein
MSSLLCIAAMITVLINDLGASSSPSSERVGFQEEKGGESNHSDSTTECIDGSEQDSSDASPLQ